MKLLHANTSVTPPHQYLAFIIGCATASKPMRFTSAATQPTNSCLAVVGLAADDYPSLIARSARDLSRLVDGVGEGTQAKRGLAVIVDHLTPPLASTPLYDQLLALRQIVESYEAASSDSLKSNRPHDARTVIALNLKTR